MVGDRRDRGDESRCRRRDLGRAVHRNRGELRVELDDHRHDQFEQFERFEQFGKLEQYEQYEHDRLGRLEFVDRNGHVRIVLRVAQPGRQLPGHLLGVVMVTATAEWRAWSTTVSLVVTDTEALAAAEVIAREVIDAVDLACSRFRDDSELSRLQASPSVSTGAMVSPLLAELVRAALDVAAATGGLVDPTLGNDLVAIGYDRDIARLEASASSVRAGGFGIQVLRRSPGWKRVSLVGDRLAVPADLALDLGATAKAFAADRIAARIADTLGCGALVSLGGDIATAGPTAGSHWEVLVQDLPTDPAQQVAIPAGAAVATSSTQKRRWTQAGMPRHHILDPRFGLPVDPVWRSATVAARSCLHANALTTAALVSGVDAPQWLRSVGADARLVDREGRVVTTGGWPVEPALTPVGAGTPVEGARHG